ncbi:MULTISPECIES: large-conductance mechanosensitive channel protein MscL [unclassified Yoonia]|uniref:large-conductance mechanosensitive channel protein MscL n=1 Tax=unclassified Yoonia TaxID=2629118 RepID=UPI002AFFBD87|nr:MULTISPECIES: large-conductance mechanosensitive channel protein MscL [unclassified Yoonia]
MLNEFRDFIAKGNVMDLAVGIIIGAAFTAIVNSLVGDLIQPLIGLIVGGLDFSALSFGVGDAQFMYGSFITAVINFVIIAFVVFILVKMVNRVKSIAEKPQDVAPEVKTGPSELDILIEIRDALARSKVDPPHFDAASDRPS